MSFRPSVALPEILSLVQNVQKPKVSAPQPQTVGLSCLTFYPLPSMLSLGGLTLSPQSCVSAYRIKYLKLSSEHQKYFFYAKKNKNHGKICGKESSIGAQLLPDC